MRRDGDALAQRCTGACNDAPAARVHAAMHQLHRCRCTSTQSPALAHAFQVAELKSLNEAARG